jgi:DNA-binding response OmpR family regulator
MAYPAKRPRVLVVEDDDSTREFLKYVVEEAGYDVETVGDGQSALDAAFRRAPNLVVLDLMLPEIHGLEVCHRLKTSGRFPNLKVLIVSAKAFPADRRQAQEVGADGFLPKPVNPVELLDLLRVLLNDAATPTVIASPTLTDGRRG